MGGTSHTQTCLVDSLTVTFSQQDSSTGAAAIQSLYGPSRDETHTMTMYVPNGTTAELRDLDGAPYSGLPSRSISLIENGSASTAAA